MGEARVRFSLGPQFKTLDESTLNGTKEASPPPLATARHTTDL